MSARATLCAFAAAAILAASALLIAGASDHRNTAFSLDVPNNVQAAPLPAGQTLCQGPIAAQAPFTSMQIWALPSRGLAVELRAASGGRILASGRPAGHDLPTGRMTFAFAAAPVARGERFEVCIRNVARTPVAIMGGPPSRSSGALGAAGRGGQYAAAILFLRARGPSLLSLLGIAFARASLFKLSWVGAWTYWLLLLGILAAVALCARAIGEAVRADAAATGPGHEATGRDRDAQAD